MVCDVCYVCWGHALQAVLYAALYLEAVESNPHFVEVLD